MTNLAEEVEEEATLLMVAHCSGIKHKLLNNLARQSSNMENQWESRVVWIG